MPTGRTNLFQLCAPALFLSMGQTRKFHEVVLGYFTDMSGKLCARLLDSKLQGRGPASGQRALWRLAADLAERPRAERGRCSDRGVGLSGLDSAFRGPRAWPLGILQARWLGAALSRGDGG